MKIPKEARNLYEKAKKFSEENDYKNSLKYLNQALELKSDYAEVIGELSFVHFKLNFEEMSREEVYKLAEKSLKLKLSSPMIWRYMGIAYEYIKHDHEEAIKCYNKALKLDSNYFKALYSIGLVYHKKKEYQKAIEYWEKTLELNPYFYKALGNIGIVYNTIKEYDRSIEVFKKAIEINPDDSFLWQNLSSAYIGKKDFKTGFECLKKVQEIDPSSTVVNDLSDLVVNMVDKFRQNLPKSRIEDLEKYDEIGSLYYQKFKKVQKIFKDYGRKYPNNSILRLLSNLDLSNLGNLINSLQNLPSQNINTPLHVIETVKEDLADLYNTFNFLRKQAIHFIPYKMERNIRKNILKLSVKFRRLQIAEIAEKCNEPEDCVIVVIRYMIERKELYAEYFESTKSLVFDEQANINEIDLLMKKFDDWNLLHCKNCGSKIIDKKQVICEYCGKDF